MRDPKLAIKIRKITAKVLEERIEKVTTASSFSADLHADSLDHLEMIMAFEEAFDICIPDDAAEKLLTVGQVIDYIEMLRNNHLES